MSQTLVVAITIGAIFYWINTNIITRWLSIEKYYQSDGLLKFLVQLAWGMPTPIYVFLINLPIKKLNIKADPKEMTIYTVVVFGFYFLSMIVCLRHIIRFKKSL